MHFVPGDYLVEQSQISRGSRSTSLGNRGGDVGGTRLPRRWPRSKRYGYGGEVESAPGRSRFDTATCQPSSRAATSALCSDAYSAVSRSSSNGSACSSSSSTKG